MFSNPSPRVDKNFKCGICGKNFFLEEQLKVHFFLHTKNKTFKCDLCEKVLSCRKTLRDHAAMHSNERPFKCKKCKRKFASERSRSKHTCSRKEGKKPQFKCRICDKQFQGICALRDHVNCHVSEKSFQCGICNRCFPLKGHLKLHLLVHTKESPYKCDKCGKPFITKASLKFHMRTHPGEQVWRCQSCGDNFVPTTVPPSDKDSQIVDNSDHPLSSDHNYFTFSSERIKLENAPIFKFDVSLEDHNYSYPNLRQYRCERCEKMFLTNPTLEDHNYMDNRNVKHYVCSICKTKFKSYLKYMEHLKFHSKKSKKNDDLNVDSKQNVRDALRVHSHLLSIHSRLQAHSAHTPQLKLDTIHDIISMYI